MAITWPWHATAVVSACWFPNRDHVTTLINAKTSHIWGTVFQPCLSVRLLLNYHYKSRITCECNSVWSGLRLKTVTNCTVQCYNRVFIKNIWYFSWVLAQFKILQWDLQKFAWFGATFFSLYQSTCTFKIFSRSFHHSMQICWKYRFSMAVLQNLQRRSDKWSLLILPSAKRTWNFYF